MRSIIYFSFLFDTKTEANWKPKVGIVFNNLDMAWNFWVACGGRHGFGARK